MSLSDSNQRTIVNSFELLTLYSKGCLRWKALINSVTYFIAKDMLPVSTVNDDGFKHMIQKFDPRYISPDKTTSARKYIPTLYEGEKARVKKEVSSKLQ